MSHNVTNGATAIEFAISRARGEKGLSRRAKLQLATRCYTPGIIFRAL